MNSENNNHSQPYLLSRRGLVRALFFGLSGGVIAVEIYKLGGTAVVWGFLGAIASIAVPIVWDALKNQKEADKAFQQEVDKRFDELERQLPSFMTFVQLDSLRADIGIARADCERSLLIADHSFKIASKNQDKINDIISSGVIFQLTQDVTGLKLQFAIMKRLIKKRQITLDDVEKYYENQ